MRFLFLVVLASCGGTTSGDDASVDGTTGFDATMDATIDAIDGAASDAPIDARPDGATCSMLSAMACTQCCIDSAGGTGGFELLYNQPCLMCASCGPNVKPCGTNMSPPAGAGCILCLRPYLMQGQAWTMCQQSPTCTAFVDCFATCPTK